MSGSMRLWAMVIAMTIGAMAIIVSAEDANAPADPAWLAAGGPSNVWVVQRDGEESLLSLVELSDGVAGMRLAQRFAEFPVYMTGLAEGPLLVFAPRIDAGESIYPLRRGRFRQASPGLPVTGSLQAMMPLRTGERLVAVESAGGRAHLLTYSDDVDRGATLHVQAGREWVRVRLPLELADASLSPADLRLLRMGGRLGVLVDGTHESVSVLWSLESVDFDSVDPDDGAAAEWKSVEVPLGLRGREAIAVGLGDEAVVVMVQDGGVDCLVLRRQGVIRMARVDGRQMPLAVVADADRLWLLYEGEDRAIEAVVLARDGTVVSDGPIGAASRGGEEGALFLLLVGWSVVMSVLVLMMPQNRHIRLVVPPEGYALAEPSRRVLAALLDLLPGLVLTSLMWGKPLTWWLSPLGEIIAAEGSMPVFTLAVLTFLYMAIGDGLFGRTVGKRLTGCRTIVEGGGKPGLRLGMMRSFLKVFCPPLIVVLLLMPYVPAPWSFGTVVVRKAD
ncbi:MAG: RDD family protein, partial [Phycisphaerales bacterium]